MRWRNLKHSHNVLVLIVATGACRKPLSRNQTSRQFLPLLYLGHNTSWQLRTMHKISIDVLDAFHCGFAVFLGINRCGLMQLLMRIKQIRTTWPWLRASHRRQTKKPPEGGMQDWIALMPVPLSLNPEPVAHIATPDPMTGNPVMRGKDPRMNSSKEYVLDVLESCCRCLLCSTSRSM